jgi:hypothetical protein
MRTIIPWICNLKKTRYIVLSIFFVSSCLSDPTIIPPTGRPDPDISELVDHTYLPLIIDDQVPSDCSSSRLGSVLFTEITTGESTGPHLVNLAQEGHTGLVGTPTYDIGSEYFPLLSGWERAFICNTHNCLEQRAQRASIEGLSYEYLSYGPERQAGVPDEEKYNLPWATQVARDIADLWGKPLMISYSTKQLHQESEERGYSWDDPSEVVEMLAPYGDVWVIQAADEFWRLDDGTVRPILSQRVYPPGEEFRAQVERWVKWIRSANPDIEIWIQLGMQRIGVEGENYPSADLLLKYREFIADLVDGIYITTIYGSIEQFPFANQEMVGVFHQACKPQNIATLTLDDLYPLSEINLVEEGWTDDLTLPCPPSGECITILPGYYYRIYENKLYPCGVRGNHQFMVLDRDQNIDAQKHLFVKFPGGGVGFWYMDENAQRVYYPNDRAAGLLTADYFRNLFFRTGASEEYAGGVTKRFRENSDFRMVIPSYCSHDLYLGTGEYNDIDGFYRWGFTAALSAVDYVQQNFNTGKIIAYGGSAGASGSFYIGKENDHVAAIIMDSQAVDLAAISEACKDGINVFGSSYPCFCPEGSQACMEVLAPRISFNLFSDEPYKIIESGFSKPVYFIWNENDASRYAYLQFENLHQAITRYNPGGSSVANKVCITDPRTPPGPVCNLHVPSGFDFEDTEGLVEEVYNWALLQVGEQETVQLFIPIATNNN